MNEYAPDHCDDEADCGPLAWPSAFVKLSALDRLLASLDPVAAEILTGPDCCLGLVAVLS